MKVGPPLTDVAMTVCGIDNVDSNECRREREGLLWGGWQANWKTELSRSLTHFECPTVKIQSKNETNMLAATLVQVYKKNTNSSDLRKKNDSTKKIMTATIRFHNLIVLSNTLQSNPSARYITDVFTQWLYLAKFKSKLSAMPWWHCTVVLYLYLTVWSIW